MQLTTILTLNCVKVPLQALDKQEAITELVGLLDSAGLLKNRDDVFRAVIEREALRSTGIGLGLAVPHGKTAGVDRLVMAIGKTSEPLEFESIDGKPVSIILLLASPLDKTGPHIQALAQISRMMTQDDFREHVFSSQSAQQLYQTLMDFEAAAP